MVAPFIPQLRDILPGWRSVYDYGARVDGDPEVNRLAIRAAVASCGARGGSIYFPDLYPIGSGVDANGYQIALPSVEMDTDPHVCIRFIGSTPPSLSPWSYNLPPQSGGGIISTLASSGKSIVGGTSDFVFGDIPITAVHFTAENMIFRGPANPTGHGLDLGNVAAVSLSNVLVDTPSYGGGSGTGHGDFTEPTNAGSTGIILPLINNGAHVSSSNVAVVEWNVGIQASEHLTMRSTAVFGCKYGLRLMNTYHPLHIDYFGSFFTANGIYIDTVGSLPIRFTCDLFAVERQAAGWCATGNDFIDANNRAWGHLYHSVVKSEVGASTDWRLSGGTNMTFTAIGGGS